MVRFEKDKIVVEIPTMFPAADWLERVSDLVYAIGAIDKDRVDNAHDCIWGLCNLILENDAGGRRSARDAAGERTPIALFRG